MRFIPAGAGNTSAARVLPLLMSVYPRWRGEHYCASVKRWPISGLSPLARGTPHLSKLLFIRGRFIPAGAGNTSLRQYGRSANAVYPRWRGEHLYGNRPSYPKNGLSPLARGTQIPRAGWCQCGRFIPAGAGNTRESISKHFICSVYPRWRGEHPMSNAADIGVGGLSPLARGTPLTATTMRYSGRFIPAGAGNTRAGMFSMRLCSVYPRWRGEHYESYVKRHMKIGLSPLARGTPVHCTDGATLKRFIPAGAGNTSSYIAAGLVNPVYPRWRGEHEKIPISDRKKFGLSPLARGTP
ncbi:hypothetical protein PEC301937_26970 [Pectobacterium carotovorum subsp. carotovorum]|nr:hypothetical protein PEC301937_26970 [Pectobacterium carotovorum subsp. carotovorum]